MNTNWSFFLLYFHYYAFVLPLIMQNFVLQIHQQLPIFGNISMYYETMLHSSLKGIFTELLVVFVALKSMQKWPRNQKLKVKGFN